MVKLLTSYVHFALGIIWMTSRGVLPQVGHGDPQVTPQYHNDGDPRVTQQPQDHFNLDDFSSLPGIQHEFKIDIGPGRSECFFQWIKKGAQLHVSFEVLRGADRNIDAYIKLPDGKIHEKHLWTHEGNTDTTAPWEGDYAICIDNGFSRFSSKLVYLFIATYVEREWQDFTDEVEAFDVSMKEVQMKVDTLQKRVTGILQLMGLGRRRSNADYYFALSSNSSVQTMSIILVLVFVTTSAVQVYFVRNMFKTVKVTTSQKPRA